MEKNKSSDDFFNGLTPDIMERYLKGTLSAEMRNKVEQYLKENPFEADAMEGLRSYSVDLNKELNSLNEQLSAKMFPRTRKSTRYIWAAAAMVTLLVASGLIIYLLLPRPQEVTPIAVNQDVSGYQDQSQSEVTEPEVAPLPAKKSIDEAPPPAETEIIRQPEVTATDQGGKPKEELEAIPVEPADETVLEETIIEDISFEQAPAPALEKASSVSSRAKSKKSTAGISAARPDQVMESPVAQPPDSWSEYLSQALRYPDSARAQGIEGSVKVRFQVDIEGNPTDFEIVSPLGYGCDEEAIRVLQQGPVWKPAKINGVPVISPAEIELNFHPKKDH